MSRRRPGCTPLEESLGYCFHNRDLFTEALTHKSYFHEHPGEARAHNERLEFLGDSVLGLVVVEHLYGLDDLYDESTMSKIKSYIVKKAVLCDIAKEMSLGGHLRMGRGEEDTGGRKKTSILSDSMEAIIGAVYLDGGPGAARDLVIRLLGGRLERAIESGDYYDYKTELQEKCQMSFGVLPVYRLASEEGREHMKSFTVEALVNDRVCGTGKGRSKKEAQQEAAREALDKLFPPEIPDGK